MHRISIYKKKNSVYNAKECLITVRISDLGSTAKIKLRVC